MKTIMKVAGIKQDIISKVKANMPMSSKAKMSKAVGASKARQKITDLNRAAAKRFGKAKGPYLGGGA